MIKSTQLRKSTQHGCCALSGKRSLEAKRLARHSKGFDPRSSEGAVLQEQEAPWHNSQLGEIISEELRRFLKTKANVSLWRHAAVAISRRHLPEGCQFKRDYGPNEKSAVMDLQAAHTSRMAGSCYARDVREAHGHVASIRAEYRQLSRNWHICMGFGVPLPPREESEKPAIKPIIASRVQEVDHRHYNGRKRTREDLEKELSDWMREEAVLCVKRQRLPHRSRSKYKKDLIETIDVQITNSPA
jgi:hypothetical protein